MCPLRGVLEQGRLSSVCGWVILEHLSLSLSPSLSLSLPPWQFASYAEHQSVDLARSVYSRACTIHLQQKPNIHVTWAQFEEKQGTKLASFPGPSRGGGERAWYTLHAHAPGPPRKMWGNRILPYTLRLSSIELHVTQMITMVTQPVAMETPAHARAVCTRPLLLLLLKGLGTRLGTKCINHPKRTFLYHSSSLEQLSYM